MIENETGADNTAADNSPSAPDTGDANATSAPDRQAESTESTGSQRGTPNESDTGTGSSANPYTTLQTGQNGQERQPPPQPQTPEEWRAHADAIEKRRQDAVAYGHRTTKEVQRAQRERDELQQRYQGIDPNEIQRYRQAQQDAARKNQKRWEPDHPEHFKFQSTLAKRDSLNAQLGALRKRGDLSPEQKAAVADDMISAALSPDEQVELKEHEAMNKEFLLNPSANARQIARQEARNAFQEMWHSEMRRMQAEQSVAKDMANPAIAELAADPHMNERMSNIMSGVSKGQISAWQVSKHIALLEARLASLQSREGEADHARAQMSEQQRLLQTGASHTRDAAAHPTRDIYKEARRIADKEGLPHGHPKFMQIVRDLERSMSR